MKTLTLALLICASIPSLAQHQAFTIKFGGTYNQPDGFNSDFGDAVGYYFGIGVQDRFDKVVGLGIDINYLNQRAGVDHFTMAVRSVNVASCIHLHTSDAFYIMAGIESGMVSTVKVEDETSGGDLEYRFGYVLGMGYALTDRWDVQARYIGPFDHMQTGFDYNAQLGMAYKISWSR